MYYSIFLLLLLFVLVVVKKVFMFFILATVRTTVLDYLLKTWLHQRRFTKNMSRVYKVICGAPVEHCVGGFARTDQNQLQFNQKGKMVKCHDSHESAFRCYARYLTKIMGFKQLGPREFQDPESGYVRVLTKKIRFGSHLRWGKEHERFMPEVNRGVI